MKPEQQIKALAELDGIYFNQSYSDSEHCWRDKYGRPIKGGILPTYPSSYDAIIPLRVKVCNTPALKVAWLNHARDIVARRIGKLVSDFDIASIKPDEDCEALLRATNKWAE